MIRCKCGEYFQNSCAHTIHKQMMGDNRSHYTVCSDCGEEFLDFTLKFLNCELDEDYHPKTARCNTCWTKHPKEITP